MAPFARGAASPSLPGYKRPEFGGAMPRPTVAPYFLDASDPARRLPPPRNNSGRNRSSLLRCAREPMACRLFFPSSQPTSLHPERQPTSTLVQEVRNTLFVGREGVGQKRNPPCRRATKFMQSSIAKV